MSTRMIVGIICGVVLLALALAIIIIPQYTSCEHNGKHITLANGRQIPMKCNWTAKSEIVVGVSLAVVGAMMTLSRRKESLRNLALLGVVLGVFAILLPTDHLIGVCTSNMECHTVMKPTLITLGSVVVGISVFSLIFSQISKEKES